MKWINASYDRHGFSVQVESVGNPQQQDTKVELPSRNLTLSVATADKLGLMFACGGLFALDELALLPRVQVMAASGLGNMLIACILDAIYDPNRSQPVFTAIHDQMHEIYRRVFSFCENNQELSVWWPRLSHPGMWLAPWQTSLASEIRGRFTRVEFQPVNSHAKVKALMSHQQDATLPVFLCGCTRTDSDNLVVLTNDIRAPAARHMHQQYAHLATNVKVGDPMDFAAILTAISLPQCLTGFTAAAVTIIEPLSPGEERGSRHPSQSPKAAMMMAPSATQYESKDLPFKTLTPSALLETVYADEQPQQQQQPTETEPALPSAKRTRTDVFLRNSLLLDPYCSQSCATYFTKLKLKHPDNNADKLLLLDGFTNSATFRSMLPIDQRSRMRSELASLQGAPDKHMDKLCAYRKQIVQCHSQSYADTPHLIYTHQLLSTLSGDFNSGPESKPNEALLSGRWSGLPRSLCELAFRWGYMQTWITYGDGGVGNLRAQTVTPVSVSAFQGRALPIITSGEAVVNCLKRVENELGFA